MMSYLRISSKQKGNSPGILQLSLAFKYVAQFWLNICFPPVSCLQTLATLEQTAFPQFINSTAVSRKKNSTYSPTSKEPTKLVSATNKNIEVIPNILFSLKTIQFYRFQMSILLVNVCGYGYCGNSESSRIKYFSLTFPITNKNVGFYFGSFS